MQRPFCISEICSGASDAVCRNAHDHTGDTHKEAEQYGNDDEYDLRGFPHWFAPFFPVNTVSIAHKSSEFYVDLW